MRVRETPFPSIGLLPTVGTRLRRQATYSAQANQCRASPCGHGRRGHRGSAAPRGLDRGGTAPARPRPVPPSPAHLQAVGAPQRREFAQRLGRARRVQIQLPTEPFHGGAGIGGPRAGHGGGARAKTAGRAGPLPPHEGAGTRTGRARGRRSRPAGVTWGHPGSAGVTRVSPGVTRLQAGAQSWSLLVAHFTHGSGSRGRSGFFSAAIPHALGHAWVAAAFAGGLGLPPALPAAAALPVTRGTAPPSRAGRALRALPGAASDGPSPLRSTTCPWGAVGTTARPRGQGSGFRTSGRARFPQLLSAGLG